MDTTDPQADLDIPEFLKRDANNRAPFMKNTVAVTPAPAPTEPNVQQDPFAAFKTELYDPEPAILAEARKRWHGWTPTKDQPKQPSLRALKSQVRREWKQQGKL